MEKYPYFPNYHLFFRETPPPPLKLNLNGNYPNFPNYRLFLKRPHHHSMFILCAWYKIWVSILIKSIVLSLFLAFVTLSDLYYPHHPPSEGCTCTFRRIKRHFIRSTNAPLPSCLELKHYVFYAAETKSSTFWIKITTTLSLFFVRQIFKGAFVNKACHS